MVKKNISLLVAMSVLFSMILSVGVMAVDTGTGFSPTSIVGVASPNQEVCGDIYLTGIDIGSPMSDKWALNKDVAWSLSLFNTTAESHGITMRYPSNIPQTTANPVHICMKGTTLGEYHGVLLIPGIGLWLKLTVAECTADKCVGANYYACNNNTLQLPSIIKGKCGVECISSSDCPDNFNCVSSSCVEIGKVSVYRFFNNTCTPTSIYPSQKTTADYDTASLCSANIVTPHKTTYLPLIIIGVLVVLFLLGYALYKWK